MANASSAPPEAKLRMKSIIAVEPATSLAPPVIWDQAWLLPAVQPQPEGAVTFTDPEPPVEPNELELEESVKLHPTPASVMVKVCPAMVSEPVRPPEPLLAFTEYVTVPLPLPLAPPVICDQAWLLPAVQPQPEGAVTFTLPEPPAELNELEFDESVKLHATPASVMVKVCPAMVSEPVRPPEPLLAFTEYVTVPLPLPLAPPVTCDQA